MSAEERQGWIDSVKGIGIILVIIGHTNPGFRWLIYGFHMPLFFVISGYLHNEEKWNAIGAGAYIKKRFISYLKPYFILSGFNFIICSAEQVMKFGINTDTVKIMMKWCFGIVYSMANAEWTPNCTPLWFLPGLFAASCMFIMLIKLKKITVQTALCVVTAGAAYLLSMFPDIRLPWNITAALSGCSFMYVGYCIKKYNLLELHGIIFAAAGAIGGAAIVLNPGLTGMASNRLGNPVLYAVGATLVSGAVLKLGKKCNRGGVLEWLGQNTIIIMGFNYFMNNYTAKLWSKLPVIKNIEYVWQIKSIVVLIGCGCIIIIWNRLKKRLPILEKTGF